MRLTQKQLASLSYFVPPSETKKNSFRTLLPSVDAIKTFFLQIFGGTKCASFGLRQFYGLAKHL
jgi:hypothetical protein